MRSHLSLWVRLRLSTVFVPLGISIESDLWEVVNDATHHSINSTFLQAKGKSVYFEHRIIHVLKQSGGGQLFGALDYLSEETNERLRGTNEWFKMHYEYKVMFYAFLWSNLMMYGFFMLIKYITFVKYEI